MTRGVNERRTIEKRVEVEVINLAQLEKILACFRTGINLEVDNKVT
jgi:hypothetical protein